MTDHVHNQLCARIEELEKEKLELNEQLDVAQQERDALAEHVERARPYPPAGQGGGVVPDMTSAIVNDCCWTFVEAMPHNLPGPIFNDLKPALYEALKQYHGSMLTAAPKPESQP